MIGINQKVTIVASGDFKGMTGRVVGCSSGGECIVEVEQEGGECVHFPEAALEIIPSGTTTVVQSVVGSADAGSHIE